MAKGYGRPIRGKKKKRVGANMMAQVQQMQERMAQTQEALADEYITVSAGGGAVTIEISGTQRVRSVVLADELLEDGDTEMLGDILTAAINEAMEQSQTMAAERLSTVTGGLDLGGLGLPGF